MENPFEIILDKLDKIELAIKELNKINQIPINEEIFFNIDELADYLKLTKPSIYTRVHNCTIPFYKVGNKLRFKKSEIDEQFFTTRSLTKNEIEKKVDQYIAFKKKYILII